MRIAEAGWPGGSLFLGVSLSAALHCKSRWPSPPARPSQQGGSLQTTTAQGWIPGGLIGGAQGGVALYSNSEWFNLSR